MAEVFGRDVGLMQQVILAGNTVGADHYFWAALAHNKKLFAEVVQSVRAALCLSDDDREIVTRWLKSIEDDCPFREKESYYYGTPHCAYKTFFHEYQELPEMKRLFWKGHNKMSVRLLCEAIECYFVVSYVLSGVWCKIHAADQKWMHEPLDALFITFPAIADGENYSDAPRGQLVSQKRFMLNEAIAAIEAVRKLHQSSFHANFDEGVEYPADVVKNIYEVCQGAKQRLHQSILGML